MRTLIILVLALCFICSPLQSGSNKSSGSMKKNTKKWNFSMKRQWHINEAGEDSFTVIDGITTLKDGSFIVLDRKNFKLFRFDKTGKHLSSYGTKGEGPGQFAKLRKMFLIKDSLIVVDNRNVHYFTPYLQYKKSIRNNYNRTPPKSFIDESNFISVTVFAGSKPDEKEGKISHYNLDSREEMIIARFKTFDKGTIRVREPGTKRTYSFSVSSLTPQMVVRHHGNRLYTAMSDEYLVKVTDLSGNELFIFGHNRERIKASEQYKKDRVQEFDFPMEIKKLALKNMPDYLNIIEDIFVDDNGFIYIYEPVYLRPNCQNVDIFSQNGKFLYTSEIIVDQKWQIAGVQLEHGYVYIVLMDENGDLALERYTITMPKSS